MKTRRTILSIVIVTILLVSCGKRPGYVLPRDKMTAVMYDLQIANTIGEGSALPAENRTADYKNRILAGVLHKHEISQMELDSSIAWYSDNMEEYKKVNDSITTRLNKELDKLREEEQAINGYRYSDTDMMATSISLNSTSPTYSFKLASTKLDKIGKEFFTFHFGVLGLDTLSRIDAAIYYTYKDTTISQTIRITNDTRHTFVKPALPDSLLNSINGYIRLSPSQHFNNGIPVVVYNVQYQDSIKVVEVEHLQ